MTGNATAAALTNSMDSVKFFMLDLGFVCRHPPDNALLEIWLTTMP